VPLRHGFVIYGEQPTAIAGPIQPTGSSGLTRRAA
jgi:hypothetical protein